jgi:hypothetical protein
MSAAHWTDDDFDALVQLSRAQDPPIDPSAVAIVLWEESGMNAASPGPPGAKPQVGGLNQMSTPNLVNLGLTREAWLAMPPCEQLPWIFRWWKGIAKQFNGGRFPVDQAELLGLNFLPGAYEKAGASSANPDAVIAGKNGPFAWAYNDNAALAAGADVITVGTIRRYLANVALSAGGAWNYVIGQIAAAMARSGTTPTPPDGIARGGNIAILLLVTGAAVWFATRRA